MAEVKSMDWMKGNAEREWLMHMKTVEYLPQEQDFLSLSVTAALLEPNFFISGEKKKDHEDFSKIFMKFWKKMKSVFGNVLIGKKTLTVLWLLAKKTDFFKIKISRCLEGSLIRNGKNI